jgi:hypothetical protein
MVTSTNVELDSGSEPVTPKKSRAKAATKSTKTTTSRSRAKVAAPVRSKLYWGVFNQQLKRVAVFEYDSRKDADRKLKELTKDGSYHFIQRIKEEITE